MSQITSNNKFNAKYLSSFLSDAKNIGYKFVTLSEFVKLGCPEMNHFVLRLDLDRSPLTLKLFNDISKQLEIPFSLFVRVFGPYNFLWYPYFKLIKEASNNGNEIGLHTSFVEWGTINKVQGEFINILKSELTILRGFFEVDSIAPHRDVNYMYNSLPFLDENWDKISTLLNLHYHGYQEIITSNAVYINETLSPHLTWRKNTPEKIIPTGKSICLTLHPHWWYVENSFELDV